MPMKNDELMLAYSFVEQTGCNIYLTGKAGTGKTTFLKSLHERIEKKLVITAPTGVAAINAGGVTVHSFFQLPLGPYIPGSELQRSSSRNQYKFSKEKKEILQCLDLLVIDEISMVRADILDAVDAVLRRYRGNSLPFGGVQLLMIGDLHQLPPVVKREEWELLQSYYNSAYFFCSKALLRSRFVSIELQHIYRQTDERFIKILNQLRDNRLDESSIKELNERYVKGFIPENDKNFITLTTHNASAESLNIDRLQNLEGNEYRLKAEIKGDFPRNTYPAPEELNIKKGAQVMFLRNDTSADRRYYNGKIGKIVHITTDEIKIACPGDSKTIIVEPVVWENIKYTLNKEKMKIEENIIGIFKQFPLKLAWAITIHKSQGLTFEKVIIDAEAAFVHGQTYVALSRCKTLDGVVLSSPISAHMIDKDQAIRNFDRSIKEHSPSQEYLLEAKTGFQQNLLLECFDFVSMRRLFNQLVRLFQDHSKSIRLSGIVDIKETMDKANKDIFIVSEQFKRQLQRLFQNGNLPESDSKILDRLNKASKWFQDKFSETFTDLIEKLHFETKNLIVEVKIKETLIHLKKEIFVKSEGIKSVENGFSPSEYMHKVSQAKVGHSSQKVKKVPSSDFSKKQDDHPELVSILEKWRSQKADEEGISIDHVLNQQALIEITQTLPRNKTALKRIAGIGKTTYKKRAEEIMDLVSKYRIKFELAKLKVIETEDKRQSFSKESLSETKKISFEMFNKGLTVDQIAKKRNLVKSTIQGHLCFFLEQGKLDINQLLPKQKQEIIQKELKNLEGKALKPIKEKLGDSYSFGEIKLVQAHQNYLNS